MGILSDITNLYHSPIVQSDTTIFNPPLKAIVVTAPGDLVIEGPDGVTVTVVCPAVASGGRYPTYVIGKVRRVLAATTIADANLSGLR